MASAFFTSRRNLEAVSLELVAVDGSVEVMTLMVDSGFTGPSGLVLPIGSASRLGQMGVRSSQTTGALHGVQQRGWVIWQLSTLSIQRATIAIFTDVAALSLPSRIDGLAGLTLLREFDQWGAQRQSDGSWQFELTLNNP